MVKQPTSEQIAFTMSNEDFPALPGTQNAEGSQMGAASQGLQGVHHHHHPDHHGGTDSLGGKGAGGSGQVGSAAGMGMDLQSDSGNSNVNMDKGAMKRGVQTSPNGIIRLAECGAKLSSCILKHLPLSFSQCPSFQ